MQVSKSCMHLCSYIQINHGIGSLGPASPSYFRHSRREPFYLLSNIRPHKVIVIHVGYCVIQALLCFTVGGWDFGSDELVNTRFVKSENLSCLLSNIRHGLLY